MTIRWFYVLVTTILLLGCEREAEQTSATEVSRPASSDFGHYDWLPQSLKDTMEQLANNHTDRHFNFYYYFTTDDINRHY